jgi:drug/metabolite transporter (DMT)-like permease
MISTPAPDVVAVLGAAAAPRSSVGSRAPARDFRLPALASCPVSATIFGLAPSAARVHLALLTVSILFGASYVVAKQLVSSVTPAAWAMFRMIAATAILVPLALWLRRQRQWPDRRTILWLGVAAFFGVMLNQVLFIEGLHRTTPAHSSVICASIPIWTLIAAVVARQERLTLPRVLAVLLALIGVQYLLGLDRLLLGTDPGFADDRASLLGDGLTLINCCAFAIHLVLMRRIGRRVDPMLATAVMFLWAVLPITAYGAPQATAVDLELTVTHPLIWCAIYMVLFATLLTYLLNTWALRHTHSSTVALYINVQPIVAVSLDTALGAPLPGRRFVVALVLVSAGLWLHARSGGKPR